MKLKQRLKKEKGITLVALIITIIVLIILAAVSIQAVYDSKLIGYATNGTQNYMTAGNTENEVFANTVSYVDSVLDAIFYEGIGITGGEGSEGSTEEGIGGSTGGTDEGDSGDTGENTGGDTGEDEEPKEPIDIGEMTEEEKSELIGKYVAYTPTSEIFDEKTLDDYSGTTDNGAISTDTSLNWRVLDVSSSTLTLISDNATSSTVYLQGYQGYNNAVLLLNTLCNTNYSNESLSATARSMNVEDIETVSSYNKEDYVNIKNYSNGTAYSITNSIYRYYPTIFASEEGGNINGGGYGNLERSEQSDYITQSVDQKATSFKFKFTYYTYILSNTYMNDKYVELFCKNPETTSNLSSYWISSRCVNYLSTCTYFAIFNVSSSELGSNTVYNSLGDGFSQSNAVRPIVSVPLSACKIGETGNGTSSSPYSIVAK